MTTFGKKKKHCCYHHHHFFPIMRKNKLDDYPKYLKCLHDKGMTLLCISGFEMACYIFGISREKKKKEDQTTLKWKQLEIDWFVSLYSMNSTKSVVIIRRWKELFFIYSIRKEHHYEQPVRPSLTVIITSWSCSSRPPPHPSSSSSSSRWYFCHYFFGVSMFKQNKSKPSVWWESQQFLF